jgi:hypothetical protein
MSNEKSIKGTLESRIDFGRTTRLGKVESAPGGQARG